MSLFKNLFQQTAIYGIATVVPRMFSFVLTPLYTDILPEQEYGEVSIIFAWIVLFNVVLAYGMETAFFRFYTNEDSKKVQATSTISIFWTSIVFLGAALLGRNYLAEAAGIDVQYITYTIWVLVLDALVIIPFSKLRAEGRPLLYAVVKIGNVAVNLGLNVFFLLYLPKLATAQPDTLLGAMYVENFQIGYIFISNLIASLLTFLVLAPHYFRISWQFDKQLWAKMMRYSFPIMIAGIAFAINETFDRILLHNILPENIAEAEVGVYSACYKLAIFMTLFATAFRLGIEPFFFSHAKEKNAPQTYAMITRYFVIFGSIILLVVIVFADLLKVLIIRNESYWEGMAVVPLIIMANFFLGIYHNLSVWYKLSDKTKMGAYISIIGAIVTLGLNFALIPKYSYMGSAVATISAYTTMMVISYILGNKYYPIPYDMKKICGYLGLSIALSLVCFYFFRENYFVGVAAIVVYAGFIYINEKATLLRIIKQG
ncbi:polysaccharide biosynthesis protein [Flavobacterium arcticum]|uniref:Polysaccharide biosynthesis protein n=1 Tax=Flavobacterium arcticum TaxID=1784713 RepID=A0A345HAW1_9FLAO|nr:oligosaccharide flippase family protein [Flavobacterium arcticum]AXG73721.1 polysaccharide biosynthesis protein [Flavobacterium arcticum]KAF2511672.1 polysaccharide biosynthesis protein [Flavobacterium arcticum]